ncbi:TetR/AcrR family transcriptional regulator [Erythrobacter oryzae]|uniref:TetR/AcrR family transcriptional regulator n=1 Tax=Erythrobacter oryzae TaxID=3019556 RepID=UPI002553F38E|nr:TetR/AcrR family transcriptional regulator [Erythrobacter sp. COR-2]
MPRTSDARDKALATAEDLFRRQGFAATGLAQIIEESGSPKGSFYFHFKGGKDQLAAEIAERFAARGVAAIAAAAAATPGDATGFVRLLCAGFAQEMRASDFTLGCALQNIATERAPGDPHLTALVNAGLEAWVEGVSTHFAACGVATPRPLAEALIAALEGARTLARASRSDAVYSAIAESFAASLRSPLGGD